jgi:hypothetical protein
MIETVAQNRERLSVAIGFSRISIRPKQDFFKYLLTPECAQHLQQVPKSQWK